MTVQWHDLDDDLAVAGTAMVTFAAVPGPLRAHTDESQTAQIIVCWDLPNPGIAY